MARAGCYIMYNSGAPDEFNPDAAIGYVDAWVWV